MAKIIVAMMAFFAAGCVSTTAGQIHRTIAEAETRCQTRQNTAQVRAFIAEARIGYDVKLELLRAYPSGTCEELR